MSVEIIKNEFKKKQSLERALTLSFLSLSFAALFIWGIFGTYLTVRAQEGVIFSNQELVARDAANKVSGFIQEKFSLLEATARIINSTLTPQKEQTLTLDYLLGTQPAFRQLLLLNKKKQKLAMASRFSEIGASELSSRLQNDLFLEVSLGNKYISPVYVDNTNCEPMVIIAVPAKNVFGDFQGVLIADVNLKFMWNLMDTVKIGKSGVAYVVDEKGNLIAFHDIIRVLRRENVSEIEEVAEFVKLPGSLHDDKPNLYKGINGATVVGTYESLGVPEWAVVIESPVTEAYEVIFNCIISSLVIMIIIAVIAGWIGSFMARRLSVPLVNLMDTAKRITNGELELQAEVSGPSEVAGLAEAFNIMTSQLKAVIESLEERDQYLQATVRRYVEFMAGVGEGKLETRLSLEDEASETNPLPILGKQLNETTASLQQITNNLKEREAELEIYAEQLKKSNTELEQFAYIASHDLQEPLRKIHSFGDRIKENYCCVLDERGLDYLQRMGSAVIRMENLINDLLKYSRVTSQARPFEIVDLNDIIKEALNDMEIRINETKAEVITDYLPTINADPVQMKQLFQNIIGNSIKYHKENVTPVINIHSKVITNKDGSELCEINIVDNGIGFDNQYAERIFGLFQRLHGRGEYEGTGIGLAICRKIVTEHKGAIIAKSKLGEGSTFTVTLPVNQGSRNIGALQKYN